MDDRNTNAKIRIIRDTRKKSKNGDKERNWRRNGDKFYRIKERRRSQIAISNNVSIKKKWKKTNMNIRAGNLRISKIKEDSESL